MTTALGCSEAVGIQEPFELELLMALERDALFPATCVTGVRVELVAEPLTTAAMVTGTGSLLTLAAWWC